MGLITWIYALSEQVYELELLPPLGNMVAEVDLTSGYLNRPGEFNIIKLDPQKVKESRAVETMSEEEIESLPEEDRFLAKYRLPKPLLEKLLSFRNKQKVRLTDEQKSRIPLGVNYIPKITKWFTPPPLFYTMSGHRPYLWDRLDRGSPHWQNLWQKYCICHLGEFLEELM